MFAIGGAQAIEGLFGPAGCGPRVPEAILGDVDQGPRSCERGQLGQPTGRRLLKYLLTIRRGLAPFSARNGMPGHWLRRPKKGPVPFRPGAVNACLLGDELPQQEPPHEPGDGAGRRGRLAEQTPDEMLESQDSGFKTAGQRPVEKPAAHVFGQRE
jgi:hypothetical protein